MFGGTNSANGDLNDPKPGEFEIKQRILKGVEICKNAI